MKYAFIHAEQANWPVEILCRVLGVSKSGYYASCRRPASRRAKQDAQLKVEVRAVYRRTQRRHGSPRIHRDLRARGLQLGKKRVERLMREEGLVARGKRRFRRTTDSNHDGPIAANLLDRQFEPVALNQAWVTDVTYIATNEGWAYLAVMLDLYSRRVVGWAMSDKNDTSLALVALRRALRGRRFSSTCPSRPPVKRLVR